MRLLILDHNAWALRRDVVPEHNRFGHGFGSIDTGCGNGEGHGLGTGSQLGIGCVLGRSNEGLNYCIPGRGKGYGQALGEGNGDGRGTGSALASFFNPRQWANLPFIGVSNPKIVLGK